MSDLTTKAAEIRAGLVRDGCTFADRKAAAALIAQQAAELAEARALAGPLGWIFTNPATGIEWSEQHPVECGEVPDAEDVQPGYAVHLHHHLIAAWEDARAYAEAAKVQRLAKEAAEAERDELLREKERLGDGWRPIETAPKKHGKRLLLALPDGRVVEGYWGTGRYDRSARSYRNAWVVGPSIEVDPTHWVPMPKPPSALENAPAGLADAHSKSPDPTSQSERIAVAVAEEREACAQVASSVIDKMRGSGQSDLRSAKARIESAIRARAALPQEPAALAPIGEAGR